jgi:hypothetical protein
MVHDLGPWKERGLRRMLTGSHNCLIYHPTGFGGGVMLYFQIVSVSECLGNQLKNSDDG